MKTIAPKLILLLVLLSSCKTIELNNDIPSCVESKILELKEKSVQNPPAEVWEWKDGSSFYYYITSDCCDQFNYLYDMKCNSVCAPDGGFTGKGDENCPDFSEDIKKTLVWKDDRK